MNRPSPIPTTPSRRGFLAVAAAGAASAVAAEVDPIFAMIAEHAAAAATYEAAVYAEGPLSSGPEMVAAEATTCAASAHAYELLWDLLHGEPTTLAGVAALLDHVSQPVFKREEDGEYPDCRRTHLTSMLEYEGNGEWKRGAEDFPGWIAKTVRSLIGGKS
jgi:hypothetical protein